MILYTLYKNSYIDIGELDSLANVHVYVNMTNRCPCACTFCLRQTKEMTESNTLWLKQEPTVEEIVHEFQKYDLDDFAEVVFCGFGEPFERVDDMIQIAGILKLYRQDLPIRVNTNGLGNLIHKKDITPMIKGRIDTISISLNAPDAQEYYELTRSRFGIDSYQAMLDFAVRCKDYAPHVVLSVVDIIGEEKIKKCQNICDELVLIDINKVRENVKDNLTTAMNGQVINDIYDKVNDEMERLSMTADYKLAGSNMEQYMKLDNFNNLQSQDTVKFVVSSEEDLKRALEIIRQYNLTEKCYVYFSPVFGKIEPVTIVDFMKDNLINGARVQLQLHKFIWSPDKKGV